MSSQKQPVRSFGEQLSVVDALIVQAFPEGKKDIRTEHGWSGRGFHIGVLRETRDFWEDRSAEVVEPAVQELEDDLSVLAAALTGRWGEPTVVDLWPYLGFDDPAYPDNEPAPEPLSTLCGLAVTMQAWRMPSTGRWLGLTVGQADREFPFELLVAVGEESSFPR
ncbi:hypothetical protein [Streptomyces aureus]